MLGPASWPLAPALRLQRCPAAFQHELDWQQFWVLPLVPRATSLWPQISAAVMFWQSVDAHTCRDHAVPAGLLLHLEI